MSTRNRRTLYLLFPVLLVGLLFAGWKTARMTASTPAAEAADQTTEAAVGSVEPPSATACQYDPSSALSVEPDQLVSFQDPMLGNPDADVTVVEFFDPNCSHCQAFHPVMKEVVAEYRDDIKFYGIPFPLWQYSLNQIEAMILAAQQDKYYEMIDLQLSQGITRGMSDQQLIQLADSLDLNMEEFAPALKNDSVRRRALYYRKRGEDAGIQSTPTVAINGRVVAGESRTVECLGQLIEQELAQSN